MEETLKEALGCADRLHSLVNELLGTSTCIAKGAVVGEFYWVAMVLLARALKHQKAIMCLAREGFAAEAAIAGLTQFEFCLDITLHQP